MQTIRIVLGLLFFSLSAVLHAATMDEARQLKDEAAQILRGQSGQSADPKVYAQAVFKLQRAEAILDELLKSDPKNVEPILEEVTASLFWARRFANLNIIRELEKGDPGKAAGGSASPPAVSGPPPKPPEAPEPSKALDSNAAEKAYAKAEAFEKSQAGNDHAIALKWFQVADETQGTDWSLRALGRAKDAQARHQAKLDAEKLAQAQTAIGDDEKLILEGNVLLDQAKLPEALEKYLAAQKLKDSVRVEQRLGHAYLKLGYQGRDTYRDKYMPMLQKIDQAKRSGNKAQIQQVYKENLALLQQLRPLENEILGHYTKAAAAFQKGLDLAGGTQLDCEAHYALLQFERKNRIRAQQLLGIVMKKYTPQNDDERTVYEYARTLFSRLGGRL